MQTTLKQLLKVFSCVIAAAVFVGCSNPAGGGGGATVTGTSGVTFTTTYTEPSLPAGSGTDPFMGHTYRETSSYGQTDCEFGNNGELTYISTSTSGSDTYESGTKYSYTYNADTKEMNVKVTHILQKPSNTAEYQWYTYAETINLLVNLTTAQINEMSGGTNYTDAQVRELIEQSCIMYKQLFETSNIWKAELDTSNNLKLRENYYKTAPSALPNKMSHDVSYSSNQTSGFISFSLTIGQETNSSSKGYIDTYKSVASTSVNKKFAITNITSNTMTAVEASSVSSSGYTPVSGGTTLQVGYTYALGNDHTLVITVTGSDNTTKGYLNTFLGTSDENPTITASSSTYTETYTLQS